MSRPCTTLVITAAACLSAVSACSGDATQRTEAHYCTEVGNHLTDLNSPTIATPADIDRLLNSWRAVSKAAPIAIEPEWNIVVAAIETAATVVPADPASVQKVADTARAGEQAANRVISYTMQRCGARIGTPPAAP
ncbi:MAG: hypothetical protein WCK21_04215 [Actinomycetota bacterium]